jgi:hypothetical protein
MNPNKVRGYAGFCKGCGELTSAILDTPGHEDETIKKLTSSFMDGLEIRRATLKEISRKLRSCQCGRNGHSQPEKTDAGTSPGPSGIAREFHRAHTFRNSGIHAREPL